MSIVTILRRADGSKIGRASGSPMDGGLWRSIQQVCADEFNCAADDVELLEITEGENEGTEAVVVDGEIVGYITQEIDQKRSRPSALLLQAAE